MHSSIILIASLLCSCSLAEGSNTRNTAQAARAIIQARQAKPRGLSARHYQNRDHKPSPRPHHHHVKTCSSISPGLDTDSVEQILANLANHSTDSWVSGTRAEALLELDYPSLSVYSPFYYSTISQGATVPAEANGIVKYWQAKLQPGSEQFIEVSGGSPTDSASIGVAFINAARTDPDNAVEYDEQVRRQVNYLLHTIPRTDTGAISTRPVEEPAQVSLPDFIRLST